MLIRLFRWLFGQADPPSRPSPAAANAAVPAPPRALPPQAPEKLDQQVPLRRGPQTEGHGEEVASTIICREAVLDRQQKIAGYQFLLQDATHAKVRAHGRRTLQLYAEVLVENLLRIDIPTLLGPRLAFIDVPDFFLDYPELARLPSVNTVIIIKPTTVPNRPSLETLRAQVSALRARSFRVGIPDPESAPELPPLIGEVDLIMVRAPKLTAEAGLKLSHRILSDAPKTAFLVRDLPGMEDFHFCYRIGASLFQGPFITSREQWQAKNLEPNFVRLTILLSKLRQDAETREIVALLKQDAAITVRLLRYINSAANGLHEHVSSIERALTLLGRAPLCRWLTILLCSSNSNQARSSAVLETALVRARTMELVALSRGMNHEAMFLTGLLSLIDVILQQPLDKALSSLAISVEIGAAIFEDKGPYAPGLALAKACESADVDAIVLASTLCKVSPKQASAWHMEALGWTLTLQHEQESAHQDSATQ